MAGPGSKKTQFKKGVSGNPKGRPSVPKELRNLKKYTAEELESLITVLFHASAEELKRIEDDPNETMIRKIMGRAVAKAHETGNMSQIEMILVRMIGKPTEKIKHMGLKPSVLVTTNGTAYTFTNRPTDEDEE